MKQKCKVCGIGEEKKEGLCINCWEKCFDCWNGHTSDRLRRSCTRCEYKLEREVSAK